MNIFQQAQYRIVLLIFCILGLFLLPVHAELFQSETYGYAFDLPEGYVLAERSGNTQYLFSHTIIPVELLVAIYPLKTVQSAQGALEYVCQRFGVRKTNKTYDTASFVWRNKNTAITALSFTLHTSRKPSSGWALAVELHDEENVLVMMCYADEQNAATYESFIISTLDSIFIDYGSYYESGPMNTFVFPAEGDFETSIDITDTTISLIFDKSDAEANQFVVDREFDILTLYHNSPLLEQAWQRYYRLIYRDAYSRLKRASFAIYNGLMYAGDIDGRPKNDFDLAQTLLQWTQGFTYERDFEGSDFLSLPATLLQQGGDCDSRSMLLAALLNHMAIDSVLFVSPEYSHAVLGLNIEGRGARMSAVSTISGKNASYIVGETTAPVSLGLIAQNMADPSKWFSVTFY